MTWGSTVVWVHAWDGIGAGVVLNGELFTGASATAGELAHVQVMDDGPCCPCGNRGCLAAQAPDRTCTQHWGSSTGDG
ncbi:ROK family protein [Streptomyces sp. NPDC058457]|uniref:ROK family protein n=1 Tax=Streptomyces sp. NPDC058457 TaxID=3346507 RepID=UPI0036683F55